MSLGRVTVQPIHVTNALPEAERIAVEVLELQLHLRAEGPRDAFEILGDGTPAIFLTTARVQKLLRLIDAPKKGKDYAREITREILPRLGLIEDSGEVKKPGGGGRKNQPPGPRSFWWTLYRIPFLSRIPRRGAYPQDPGHPLSTPRLSGPASLLRVLICQGVFGGRPRRSSFEPGSVQWAFQATGPP